MKYWFMDQHRSSHGVQRMCRVIGASRERILRMEETASEQEAERKRKDTHGDKRIT